MAYFIMNMDFNLDKKTKRLYIIKLVSDHSITAITRPCQGLDSSSILDGRSTEALIESMFQITKNILGQIGTDVNDQPCDVMFNNLLLF